MRIFTFILVGFCLLCGFLVVESGVFECGSQFVRPCILLQQTTGSDASETFAAAADESKLVEAPESLVLDAKHASAETVIIGALDPKTENAETDFKFQLELNTKGAAISKATFSNGPDDRGSATGFNNRNPEDPQPLTILSPVEIGGREILSMANTTLVFVEQGQKLQLNDLHWRSLGIKPDYGDGSQTATFEAVITVKGTGQPLLKLTKTYKVLPDSYDLDCDVVVENLSASGQQIRINLGGPVGMGREGARSDMRKAVACFKDAKGEFKSDRLDAKKLFKAKTTADRRLDKPGENFLWVAATNKYFAGVLVPLPDADKEYCDWVTERTGRFYNPDGDARRASGDETIGVDIKIAPVTLAAADEVGSSRTYNFKLYLGPKDKSLFDKNELYSNLGFVHTIDFMACCCPQSIISPLAFGILGMMRWMHAFIPNYGIVIIILVFMIRICLHPVTKKSQISMGKMSKLAPMAEEIKKKCAGNKAEMNKQLMGLYKKQGASPVMGFLPMMVQMPIWIALYSAIYASIELRGAAFLPFWITDLSVPDALIPFPKDLIVPLLGWRIESLNLLPLMMGVAFYLQQKLMPKQASAATNPQLAQQQKMMMIMMPLMFPLMLYKAPSGLNLYIMASTFAGVIEQYVIRKHIREKEEAEDKGLVAVTSKTGGKVKKKKPKPFYRFH